MSKRHYSAFWLAPLSPVSHQVEPQSQGHQDVTLLSAYERISMGAWLGMTPEERERIMLAAYDLPVSDTVSVSAVDDRPRGRLEALHTVQQNENGPPWACPACGATIERRDTARKVLKRGRCKSCPRVGTPAAWRRHK